MAKAVVVSTAEEDRRQLTWKALREIFGGSLHSERNRDGSLPDGVHIVEIGDVGVCVKSRERWGRVDQMQPFKLVFHSGRIGFLGR